MIKNKEVKVLGRLCRLQQTGSNLVQEAPPYNKRTQDNSGLDKRFIFEHCSHPIRNVNKIGTMNICERQW